MRTVLIVGATGVIGEAALAHFAAAKDWQTIALSRRTPDPTAKGNFSHVGVDLTDATACRVACEALRDVSHVVYSAVSEQRGLVTGWCDPQLMQTNLGMLRNLIEPLSETSSNLQHVTLLQGAKAYGAHAGHRPPVPARESAPRVQHENFYWLQEDYLRTKAQERGFSWTILRPQVVVGAAWGAAMNPLLPLAAYGMLRREEGKPFSFPGGELQIGQIVDAGLLAEAFEWAATAKAARNETFNIANGDVFAWREAWPALADALAVDVGPDEPMHLAEYLPPRAASWHSIVEREGLRPLDLLRFLGESHYYVDILLRRAATTIQRPMLLSTIKLRQAGFTACRDSEVVLRHWVGALRDRRLIPRPRHQTAKLRRAPASS
jgi:nucleoside-diphosphate-sugar epimerase